MSKEKIIYLEYIEEFDCYGISQEKIAKLKEEGYIADIRLPKDIDKSTNFAPKIGFLLGEDKSKDGNKYYTIGNSYFQTLLNTGGKIRFLDYENTYAQTKQCDGIVLPGGAFDNPEDFFIDNKNMETNVGKRFFAYQTAIMSVHHDKKPMLGICAGAQMIGAILGNMKMYRCLETDIPKHAIHKPKIETDTKLHQIILKTNTPLYSILEIPEDTKTIMINSRHNQSMVHPALQDYVKGKAKVKMDLYALSSSDGIPEIWGNEEYGILCVQGHPEDLAVKGDIKMQNIYNHIVKLAKKYQKSRAKPILNKDKSIEK